MKIEKSLGNRWNFKNFPRSWTNFRNRGIWNRGKCIIVSEGWTPLVGEPMQSSVITTFLQIFFTSLCQCLRWSDAI